MDEAPGGAQRRLGSHVESLSLPERFLSFRDLQRENTELRQQVAALEAVRLSLIEQRDRVEAEAARVRRELERVEAERCALETELRRASATLRVRLAGRGRALLARIGF